MLPTFGATRLRVITAERVKAWHHRHGQWAPTLRPHAYGLLRTILGEPPSVGLFRAAAVEYNPCHIRGAGNASETTRSSRPARGVGSDHDAMPERYRLMVLLAAWCGLRFGELTELRRGDVDVKRRRCIHIRRGVTRVGGGYAVGTPKTDAGTRDVSIPPHLMPVVREHLADQHHGRARRAAFPGRRR